MINPQKIDLHMHSNISDGTDSPAELLDYVRDAGLSLFALTDHDAIKGCRVIKSLLKEGDPSFITGVEFSCKDEEGQYHILGYGFDPDSKPVERIVDAGHRFRMKKVRSRIDFLEEKFKFRFPEEEKASLFAQDNPGKPHIGNLMVKYGYAKTKEEAIRNYINKIHFENEYVRPEDAIEGILGGGGIPVLAHPFYGSGDDLILGDDMDRRLRKLIGFGLQGVEAFYSGFSAKLTDQMLSMAKKYDLFVTAGSDYHGKNKLVPMGDTGLDEAREYPESLIRFLERFDL